VIVPGRVGVRRRTAAVAWVLVLGVLAVLVSAVARTDRAQGGVVVRQPPQPKSGPGGSDSTNRGVRVSSGGSGVDAWHVFEPTRPRPRKAPLAIVMHGYGEYAGYASMEALIRHTVRKGSIVISPRWQTGLVTPCPGPLDIEPCMTSAVNGIRGALAHLRATPKRVQPHLARTSYFGFSFGGIITANLANRYRELHLPRPRAIFLDDPHDGALAGVGEPALDDSLSGIPAAVKLQCHAPAEGVFSEPDQGGLAGSCNAVFAMLGHVPKKNKDLVLTRTDRHGRPTLAALHGVCAAGTAPASGFGKPNAYDWNFCWKVWDALRSCAYRGENCRYALGNTPEHHSLGRWSDGTPVTPLKIQNAAPIAP
jgi:pimeloyl-ACP methyl ester carboxylesterase